MNMEKKHTPGPWKAQTHISLDRMEIRDANGRRIAECAMDFPMSAITHDANASLIAAAPELLEALQEIVTAADGEGWSQLDASFTKARAAISKAIGA
jgi:hypothetical protein